MFNWSWSGSVNGWEFVWATLVGLVVTVFSVVIGIRSALRQERRQREAEAQKAEVATVQGFMRSLLVRMDPDREYAENHVTWPRTEDVVEEVRAYFDSSIARERGYWPSAFSAPLDWMQRSHDALLVQLEQWRAEGRWTASLSRSWVEWYAQVGVHCNDWITGYTSIDWFASAPVIEVAIYDFESRE